MTPPLQGLHVCYTRDPKHLPPFRAKLNSLGAQVSALPLLTLLPLQLTPKDHQQLQEADSLIFTSANAVQHYFRQTHPKAQQQLISIGEKTTQQLKIYTTNPILTAPAPYNSEALLSIFTPKNQRIALITAPNGRLLLSQTLSQHNHLTTHYPYQRHCATFTLQQIQHSSQAHALTIASRSALDCLMQNYPHSHLKLLQCRTFIVAISKSVSAYAQQLGFQQRISAQRASDDAIIEALITWWHTQRRTP